MKRKIFIGLALVAMMALAGCADDAATEESVKDIERTTGDNVSDVVVGGSYSYEVRKTEQNQIGLVTAQPPFQMEQSLERENLIKRYQYLNDRNNVHHVYMLSNDGTVIAYFVAQGKVSSVNSKLTNDRQIVASQQCIERYNTVEEVNCFKTVESPQMDGSYGTNGNGIFFFTPEGKYVEYNGKYVVSEEPLNIQTAVSLEHQVGEDGEPINSSDDDNSTDG